MDVALSAVNWPVCTFGHSIGFDLDQKLSARESLNQFQLFKMALCNVDEINFDFH